MKIIVCVKQVPDTNEVRINHETGTLIRDGVPSIINPDDKNAIEEALRIKDEHEDVHVTILSMGPPQAKSSLNEALAMGADEAVLITDRAFAGSDTWATSTIIAAAIEKLGKFDIVFCGRQAIDGDTAQVGPETAEFLDYPQITYVQNLEVKPAEGKVIAERLIEGGHFVIEAEMPVVITAIKELNEPRYMSTWGIFQNAKNTEIKVLTVADLDIDLTQIGLKGSPTNVFKTFVPSHKFEGEILQGDNSKEKALQLMFKMKEKHII